MIISRMLILSVFFIAVFIVASIGTASADQYDDKIHSKILNFLENDTTDKNEYLPWYTCGHFARDLSRNASKHNISIGSAIVGNHPTFLGHENHIINYIYIGDEIIFIEPQSDICMHLADVFFKWEYIRLYPDGTQVPTYRTYGLAPSIRYDPEAVYNAI